MTEDMLMHRIKAHRSAPDVYDPPTFKDMADRIEELEAKLAKAVAMALEDCPFREGTGSYNDWWYKRRVAIEKLIEGTDDELG